MEFGIFLELQLPRPWGDTDEQRLFQNVLDQVELADRLGFDYVWEVEHHFLEEYSHSSAPEVFLAACSQRTRTIRLGHGIMLLPHPYNHPVRVAERIATLDLVSNGRVEWGTGESSSMLELEGFGIDYREKHEMWLEALSVSTKMLCTTPFAGHDGKYFSIPPRNVVPKPVQKPHPPLWIGCQNRNLIRLAAKMGMGALNFAFHDYEETRQWIEDYYGTFNRECEPIGQAVNPKFAVVISFFCDRESGVASERAEEGIQFFGFALGHYMRRRTHSPGITNLWQNFKKAQGVLLKGKTEGIGDVNEVRSHLENLEEIGVDQVIFMLQNGRTHHEHICETLELFATEIMPAFKERHAIHASRKAARVEAGIERASRLIPPMPSGPAVGNVRSGHAWLTQHGRFPGRKAKKDTGK